MPTDTIETTVMKTSEEEQFTCSNCGCLFPAEDSVYFDDQELCQDCLEELTRICSHCGERIWNASNCGDSSIVLCQRCYDNHYTTCESCGSIICFDDAYHADDDGDLCYGCYCSHQSRRRAIHEYSYKPDSIFYPEYDSKTLYMGVELEIDGGGEDSENAESILSVCNRDDEYIYIKHDGSLNNGMELVSHPATLEYHLKHIPWADICSKALELGYTSHNAGTAGLHVHVSRSALGDTYQEQEDTIARILYFVEAHFDEMLRFSRRTLSQLNRWASRYGLKDSPKQVLEHAKNCNLGRYTAVNLLNYDTIEIRMFRGTLRYQTFIAALQIVNEICKAAISMSDDEFRAMSWDDFVQALSYDGCAELIEYLRIRGLYSREV
jgi:hypothetical protein